MQYMTHYVPLFTLYTDWSIYRPIEHLRLCGFLPHTELYLVRLTLFPTVPCQLPTNPETSSSPCRERTGELACPSVLNSRHYNVHCNKLNVLHSPQQNACIEISSPMWHIYPSTSCLPSLRLLPGLPGAKFILEVTGQKTLEAVQIAQGRKLRFSYSRSMLLTAPSC